MVQHRKYSLQKLLAVIALDTFFPKNDNATRTITSLYSLFLRLLAFEHQYTHSAHNGQQDIIVFGNLYGQACTEALSIDFKNTTFDLSYSSMCQYLCIKAKPEELRRHETRQLSCGTEAFDYNPRSRNLDCYPPKMLYCFLDRHSKVNFSRRYSM